MKAQTVIKNNFIDYAEDAIPNYLPSCIDGLLPVHRKIIYALDEAGINSNKPYKKMLMCSAEVMKYYVYGDIPLTEAMKNSGSNFLLYPYLDPKGAYPDKNRRDGKGASPRYIECKLSEFSEHLLDGIKYKNVPFVPNWDDSREEPVYLPSPIPNCLINYSESISVGFASKIPSHNLNEVCDAFINYIDTGNIDESIKMIKGIDAPTGGQYIYEEDEIRKIFTTGKGSYQMVSKWHYDKKENAIVITEIPLSTVIEDLDDKLRSLIEKGKFREIVDIHDNTGKDGLQYNIYLKRGTDVDTVIQKLRKMTPFQSSVPVNMTMLMKDGMTPHLYTLQEIMDTWISHRIECIKNELVAENISLEQTRNKMEGLVLISEDLDLVIKLIRESKSEKEAIQKLTDAFNLNKEQASYVSTIRMVNLNEEWIKKQLKEYETIKKKMESNEKLLKSEDKIKNKIAKQLEDAKEKFGRPRKTEVLYNVDKTVKIDTVEDYNCTVVVTKGGYVKKVIRNSENHKLKDNDEIMAVMQTTNRANLLVFTNKANMYTAKISTLEDTTPSSLGQYLPSLLNFESDEEVIYALCTNNYEGNLIIAFENGKVARIALSAYKTSLKKMSKAYNTESKIVYFTNELPNSEDDLIVMDSTINKRLCYAYKDIRVQGSRVAKGVQVMKAKNDSLVKTAMLVNHNNYPNYEYYLTQQAGVGKYIK